MNETEREILELAAKVVGYKIFSVQNEKLNVTSDNKTNFHWNPIKDNSDAILLATKLCSEGKMRVQISEQYVACHFLQDGVFVPHAWDYDGIQPQEAFRKCVTHTAAEIGRNMK